MPKSDKPTIEETHFFKIHKVLQNRPTVQSFMVSRATLEGLMREIISAAGRLEKMQESAKLLMPSIDFTSDTDPQDTILSLFRETRVTILGLLDTCDGEHLAEPDKLKDLAKRISELTGAK